MPPQSAKTFPPNVFPPDAFPSVEGRSVLEQRRNASWPPAPWSAGNGACAPHADGAVFAFGGEEALATPDCGLFLSGPRALIVSDLHLEKGSSFAMRGQMLPPYDTRAGLARLAALIQRFQPRLVVSLGDSFHDRAAADRLSQEDRLDLATLMKGRDWIWIAGNHDPAPPKDLGGQAMEDCAIGAVVLRHAPSAGPLLEAEICGHLHPCARVQVSGGRIRRKCYALGERRLVLPAFGAFTGGLNVMDPAFAPLFPDGLVAIALSADRVFPIARDRLIPDGV